MAGPGGAVHHWYLFEYEFAFMEVCFLLVLIPVGLVFEVLCHRAHHWVSSNTYSYGSAHSSETSADEGARREHDKSVGNQRKEEHKRLYLVLLQRMGSEFMTLGFMALVIFVAEVQGLFHALENLDHSCDDSPQAGKECFHLPETSLDWLHTAEITHFSLFLGMCLYFALMATFVRGALREIRLWEKFRYRDLHNQASIDSVLLNADVKMPTMLGSLPSEQQYRSMQEKFLEAVVRHQLSDEQFRRELLRRCGAADRADDDPRQLAQWLQRELRGPAFDFSAYLAFQIEAFVADNISMPGWSWCVVWLYLAITWPLHRLAFMTMPQVALSVLVVPTCAGLLSLLLLFRSQQRSLTAQSLERIRTRDPRQLWIPRNSERRTSRWIRRLACLQKKWPVLRGMQVICLILSYALARMVFSQPDWYSDHFEVTLISIVALLLLWLVMMLWLQFHAPIFLALISLPPYFHLNNEHAMTNFWKAFTGGPALSEGPRPWDGSPCSTSESTAQVAPTDEDNYPAPADASLSPRARGRPVENSPGSSCTPVSLEGI